MGYKFLFLFFIIWDLDSNVPIQKKKIGCWSDDSYSIQSHIDLDIGLFQAFHVPFTKVNGKRNGR